MTRVLAATFALSVLTVQPGLADCAHPAFQDGCDQLEHTGSATNTLVSGVIAANVGDRWPDKARDPRGAAASPSLAARSPPARS
jgi:hypothetical protein